MERPLSWKRATLLTLLALAAVLIVAEFTPLDFWVSDHFHDAAGGKWLVKHAGQPKLIFYKTPLLLLKISGFVIFAVLLIPHRWLAPRWRLPKRALAVVLLSLVLVPSLVASLKRWTGMYCPQQLVRYGGKQPVLHLFERAPEGCCAVPGRCWPAGHASGGFALMSLCALGRTRRQKILGVAAGLAAGWIMGGYHMVDGNHFLSHTLITMLLAWTMILFFIAVLKPFQPVATGPTNCG